MPKDDILKGKASTEGGIEYRAAIRFPRKDYEFLQELIVSGEYTSINEIVRDAVKRSRLEWGDMETARNLMPMIGPMIGMKMMPKMKRLMRSMCESDDPE